MGRVTMTEWQKEKGPSCFCGAPTIVTFIADGERKLPTLLCFLHEKEAGATFPLPKERPDNWPNLSNAEMIALIERGEKEQEADT